MATYRVWSGGDNSNGTTKATAYTSMASVQSAHAIVGGDIILVHKTHAYSSGGASITWTLPETGTGVVAVYCVDMDASDALSTGAIEETGGNAAFNIGTSSGGNIAAGLYVHGVTIKTGSGGSEAGADINVSTAGNGRLSFSACQFWTNSTNAGATKLFGVVSSLFTTDITFSNCTFKGGATTQFVTIAGRTTFYNCSQAAGGTTPTVAISPTSGIHRFYGCDWLLCTYVISIANAGLIDLQMSSCVIPASIVNGSHPGLAGGRYEFISCAPVDAVNGANILGYYYVDGLGTISTDQSVFLTAGGGSGTLEDGAIAPYSLKMIQYAAVTKLFPQVTRWMPTKITSAGSKAISMQAADTEGAVLKNNEAWTEYIYLGGANVANSPQGQYETGGPVVGAYRDPLIAGSDLTDTAVDWTGATMNDTYTLSKTLTIDYQGYVLVRAAVGKVATNPVYIDPLITVG